MNRIECRALNILLFGMALCVGMLADASVVPGKRIKLVSSYVREKGKDALKRQLTQWHGSGYTIDADQSALDALATLFGMSGDQASAYISDLNGTMGSGKGDGLSGGSTGSGQGSGNGSGSGTGSGGSGSGFGDGQKGGMMPGFSEGGIGGASNGGDQEVTIPIVNEDELVAPPAPPMPFAPEKNEEKNKEPKKTKKAFEYTLEPLLAQAVLSNEEKAASDELFISVLNRIMQTAYGDKQTAIRDIVVDERGGATGPFDALAPSLKVPSDREKMNVEKPKNGFDTYYLYVKDRCIALAGYKDVYKKRQELRDLLGSEEQGGTLKKCIEETIAYIDFDSLYKALTTKSDMLNQWIAVFEPCFFDTTMLQQDSVRRMFETILINAIVARRPQDTVQRARQITSDELAETIIIDVLTLVTKEIPAPSQTMQTDEQEAEEEKGDNSITSTPNKTKTKVLLNDFFSTTKQKTQMSVPGKVSFALSKNYVLVLYDSLNRLRVNPRFCREFEILGLSASQQYQAAVGKGGINGRLAIPLLLWLNTLKTTKTAREFRDLALAQLFFDKEDFAGVLAYPTVFLSLTTMFDFYMQEQKKNRAKINIGEFLSKELVAQKDMRGIRSVLNRLQTIVGSSMAITRLKELCDALNISKDTFLSMINTVIDEQKGAPLQNDAAGAIAKIIETYNKANEKKAAIMAVVTKVRDEYRSTKKPVTKMLYDKLVAANTKLKFMPPFKMQEMFFGLSRMPDMIYSLLASSACIGSGTELAKIVTKQEFRTYVVPYGLLLDVFKQAYSDRALLRNALEAMNQGAVKASERYPEAISASSEMKALINDGLYKGALQALIAALQQNNIQSVIDELSAYVKNDAINPLGSTKYAPEFAKLLEDAKGSLAQQFLQTISISIEALNSGSGECPESAPDCLIVGISLSDKNLKRRNALFYQGLQNAFAPIIKLLKPNGKAITVQALKDFDIQQLKTEGAALVEKAKNIVQLPFFAPYWKQTTTPGELNREQQEMVQSVQGYVDSLTQTVASLQVSVGGVPSSTPSSDQTIPAAPSNGIPPPPPPAPNF